MKIKTNLAYVFLCIGILNVLFLIDTILTDPEIEFFLFMNSSSKAINVFYYGITSAILFLATYFMLNNKKIKKCHN